jgi:hypothetical protein
MDQQDRAIPINKWFNLRRRVVAQIMCVIIYCYVWMSRERKLSYSMNSERERVREEIMYRTSNYETSRNILRMNPQTFFKDMWYVRKRGGFMSYMVVKCGRTSCKNNLYINP